jgi:hypothetical protein
MRSPWIQTHQPAKGAPQSPDGQYRDRSGQYAGAQGTLANGSKYTATGWRAVMPLTAEYSTAETP